MNQNTEQYTLDFVIPIGPTGPTGPNPPICYINYNTSNNSNILTIRDAKTFNSNGEFSTSENMVNVHSGNYEITFCGKIETDGSFQNNIMVSLQENLGGSFSQPIDGMTIVLPQGTKCMHFSETRIVNFKDEEGLKVVITNNNPSPVTVSMGALTLKKILVN